MEQVVLQRPVQRQLRRRRVASVDRKQDASLLTRRRLACENLENKSLDIFRRESKVGCYKVYTLRSDLRMRERVDQRSPLSNTPLSQKVTSVVGTTASAPIRVYCGLRAAFCIDN